MLKPDFLNKSSTKLLAAAAEVGGKNKTGLGNTESP